MLFRSPEQATEIGVVERRLDLILDEVEAALDDANLGRLLGVFEKLRASSQLIVITHQKRTMEIADALYGVSMRQDGVSAVVGQRVGDRARAAAEPAPVS